MKVWKKAIEKELDQKDIELLNILAYERKFTGEEIEEFSKKMKITKDEVLKRIKELEKKGIILKEKISLVDPIRIWDNYYIVFIKCCIAPPIVGPEIKFPTGWRVETYLERLKDMEKKMNMNLIRHAYCLQGTEWDIMLIITAHSQEEYVAFMDEIAKQGWMSKGWSFSPVELGNHWIFDPVAVPSVKDFEERVKNIKIKRD